jgi:choline kinase
VSAPGVESGVVTPVILAAGAGSRMGGVPKALCQVGGRPLIDRCLDALAGAGLGRPVVVTGHHADEVEAHVRRAADAIRTTLHAERNNSHSLAVAVEQAPLGRLLVLNCDLVFDAGLLSLAVASPGELVLMVERGVPDAEALKVQERDGRVVALGKQLDRSRSSGEFIGISVLDERSRSAYLLEERRAAAAGEGHLYYEDLYSRICARVHAVAVEVAPGSWAEVDLPSDLVSAEAVAART